MTTRRIMRFVTALPIAALFALALRAPAAAEQIHLSHYGEVMTSVPWAVALELDLFRKNGVDVTSYISSQGGGTTIRNMLAGGLGFGCSAAGATVTAIKAGLPVKIVGSATDSAADYAWVVLKNSPLQSMKDVKGRNFGITTPGGVTYVYAQLLLKQAGLTLKDVNPVPLGTGAGLAALDAGKVDTTYEYEPLSSRDVGKYRILASVADAVPHITTLFLVATQDMIDNHPKELHGLTLAYKQAVDYIYAHPEEAAKLAAKQMVGVSPEVVERSTLRLAKVKYWSHGGFDKEALDKLQDVLLMTGEIKSKVDFASMIDDRFLAPGTPPLGK